MKLFLGILAIILLTSCVNTKKVTYFNDLNDAELTSPAFDQELPFQKNDILSISVSSLNPEASVVFNAPNLPASSTTSTSSGSTPSSGYLINEDGLIDFPMLGQIKAAGLTKRQLAADLGKKINDKKLLLDPIITIRQLNYHVTVLGEVSKPSVLTVPSEKINIMEAIGLAGDLTIYAKKDNVLLIREENGKKIVRRLNLNSKEILTSPYYHLQSNDIIYAEPNKSKVASTSNAHQWLPVVLSALSVIIIVADRVIK